MSTDILVNDDTALVWADATDYNSAVSGFTRTHQLDLTSLADTKARQGDKGDFGNPRAREFTALAWIEFGSAPAAGEVLNVYLSCSTSATAATGNTGGASGSDAAYKDGEESEWTKQLTYVGTLVCTADGAGTTQAVILNRHLRVPARYGMPIVQNESGVALDSDAVNMCIVFVPNKDQSQ